MNLWRETYEKNVQRAEEAIAARTEILNRLVEEKKSFILLIYTKDCEGREYHATEGAMKILAENGIPYFYTNDLVSEYDMSLYQVCRKAPAFRHGDIRHTIFPR